MLEATSVAVVGASVREGSVGHQSIVELVEGGFEGRIVPVNPKYGSVLGLPAVRSMSDIDEPVDLAILAVSNALLEEQLRLAADAGAASAVIFASGYEEPREDAPPLTERLAAIARQAGMAVCGGNCMGFANLQRRLRALGFYEPKDAPVGGITFLSHSGSAFSAMIHNDRLLGLNLAVSAGQEFVTTVADYLHYALGLESTKAVGLFIETIRDPERFHSALEIAASREVPIVALKVGRETLTRELVAAHSGALAGEDGAYEALFDAYGVSRVESLDEMADTLALFDAGRRAGPGGLASVHDSGGERALLVDAAAAVGVPFARISPATIDRLAALLDPGLPPVNPLDFWGTGREAHEIVTGCVRALLEDEDVAALAFSVDLTTEEHDALGYVAMAKETFPETSKPYAMLSNFAGGIDRTDAKVLHDDGIAVLEGTLTGLAAFKHLFAYRDHRALEPVVGSTPVDGTVRARWQVRLSGGEDLDELDGLELLAAYGIPVPKAERASTREETLAAAGRVGFPVALKTAEPNIQHKSDVDGVKLGLADVLAVGTAYADLAERLGPKVLVAEMAPPGVEIHVGIVRDVQFGPLVLVAAGGLLVEVLRDRRLAVPPLDRVRASRLVDGLKTRPLLDGVRGQPPGDIASLVDAIVGLSWLAHDLGEHIEALDANPFICSPTDCVAVDALLIPRRR